LPKAAPRDRVSIDHWLIDMAQIEPGVVADNLRVEGGSPWVNATLKPSFSA